MDSVALAACGEKTRVRPSIEQGNRLVLVSTVDSTQVSSEQL